MAEFTHHHPRTETDTTGTTTVTKGIGEAPCHCRLSATAESLWCQAPPKHNQGKQGLSGWGLELPGRGGGGRVRKQGWGEGEGKQTTKLYTFFLKFVEKNIVLFYKTFLNLVRYL